MSASQLGKTKPPTEWREYPEPIDNQQVIRTLEQALQDLEKIGDVTIPKETHLAIREIEDTKLREERIFAVLEAAGVASLPLSTPLSLLFLLLGWRQGLRYEKFRQLVHLMKELDEAFKDKGIEMEALIEHSQNTPVDVLLRFPGRHFFLLCLRSCGHAEIVFNEKRERFFQKKPNGGLRVILPDPVGMVMQQATTLQKHYRQFFGGTSKAARRPLCRLMIVCQPSRLAQHREELYEAFGEVKALSIHYEKGGSLFAVNREDVVVFVKEYLAFRINKERGDDRVD